MARINTARLKDLLEYWDGTLIWRLTRPYATTAKKGTSAGTIHDSDRIRIRVDGKVFWRARLVWQWHHGEIPRGWVIDHIDHNRLNDRIENLRAVPYRENYRNVSLSPRNTSGFNGVSYNNQRCLWMSYIMIRRKLIYLGAFDSFEDAKASRVAANLKYHFHPTHGQAA